MLQKTIFLIILHLSVSGYFKTLLGETEVLMYPEDFFKLGRFQHFSLATQISSGLFKSPVDVTSFLARRRTLGLVFYTKVTRTFILVFQHDVRSDFSISPKVKHTFELVLQQDEL
jgi:hypothetical protein